MTEPPPGTYSGPIANHTRTRNSSECQNQRDREKSSRQATVQSWHCLLPTRACTTLLRRTAAHSESSPAARSRCPTRAGALTHQGCQTEPRQHSHQSGSRPSRLKIRDCSRNPPQFPAFGRRSCAAVARQALLFTVLPSAMPAFRTLSSSLALLLLGLSFLAACADAYEKGDGTAYSGECSTFSTRAPVWRRLSLHRLDAAVLHRCHGPSVNNKPLAISCRCVREG